MIWHSCVKSRTDYNITRKRFDLFPITSEYRMLRAIIGLIPQHRYFQYNVVPRINGTNHSQTKRGGSIEPFDLLDFDAYDEFLQTFAKTGVPKPPRIRKRHRKRILWTQFIKAERRETDRPKQLSQIVQMQQKNIRRENVGKTRSHQLLIINKLDDFTIPWAGI